MENKNNSYLFIVLMHVLLGVAIFVVPILSKIYALLILIGGILYIVKKQNRNHEVLILAGYITGSEVLLRATGGVPIYEFAKYAIIILMFYGMFYSGFSRNAVPYWVYLLLLIPSIVISTQVLNTSTVDRKIISFTISGPICLGICALYTYYRKISMEQLNKVLTAIALPILSFTTYMILYTPSIRDVVTGTDSNFSTSGGFGPNQVSTVLGLGIFIFFTKAILDSKTKLSMIVNLIITCVISFRAIVTFSRGGVFTSLLMVICFFLVVYYYSEYRSRVKLNYTLIFSVIAGISIWTYSSIQTGGLIEKRYANEDARGKEKESKLSGREELMTTEMENFYKNPVFGVGVGKAMEIRREETGIVANSHNEITRLLAEHGSLGIAMLLILFVTPLILYLDNKQNLFMLSFLIFWLLTINHAAMRIAAPAFVYSLSLLKVYIKEPAKIPKEV